MAVNPDFRDLFSEFNAVEAKFLVIGAHAVTFYSTPRYTKDVDIWIGTETENAGRIYEALSKFGAPLHQLSLADLSTPEIVFQIGVEPNRIDLLTTVGGVAFEEAWARREQSTYGDVPISIIALQDLMATKIQAGRPQDLLDLETLKQVRRLVKIPDQDKV